MKNDRLTAIATGPTQATVFVDLADTIRPAHIQAMTRTLARILVARALIEHGLKPANDNQ